MSDYHAGSFTSGYEEYWRKSQSSVDEAIKSYRIVLDTNAILNLYRMNSHARDEYLHVIETVASRIWIPRQVADEFHRNRLSSVDVHIRALKEKSGAVVEASEVLLASLRDFARLRSLASSANAYIAPFNESIRQIVEEVRADVDDFDLSPEHLVSDDPILRRLAVIFDNRVGNGIASENRDEVKQEAERRGKEKIPPGYKDVSKKGEDGYGDYFIWREILEYAQEVGDPILFISTDVKEDWVRMQCGLSVGPRPELVQEMRTAAGVAYSHITLATFLTRVPSVLNVRVSQNTIDQVKHRSDVQRKIRKEFERLSVRIHEMDIESASARQVLREAEQREMMAATRLAGGAEVLSGMGDSHPERSLFAAELEYFQNARDEAAATRHGALVRLQALSEEKAALSRDLSKIERELE
ncbi:PIN domain-containing protein [Streptomyces sp. NPDC003015]